MKVIWAKILLKTVVIFFATQSLIAQSKINLKFNLIDKDGGIHVETTSLKDSLLIGRAVHDQLYDLYYQGFLGAQLQELDESGNSLIASILMGDQYQLTDLNLGNIDPAILDEIDFRSKYYSGKAFRFHLLEKLFISILNYTENHGYPFATIKLDSIGIINNQISAELRLDKGPKIVFDSLKLPGYDNLKTEWLAAYLNIREGEPFSQKIVNGIAARIEELPFLELVDSEILFTNENAKVLLTLKERKVNSIDGFLGVFPNANENSKVLVTGNLNLHLYNLFSSAKELHLDWQKVNVNSQTLNVGFAYPQILKMPLGINLDFSLLKEDTLFLNSSLELALDFSPGLKQKIWFNSQWESSRTLGESPLPDNSVPVFNDYTINYYGVSYRINQLNRRILPTHGWWFSVEGFTGQKKIIRDISLDESIYDKLDLKSTQYKLKAEWDQYFTLGEGYILRFRSRTANIFGENLFRNDLIRLGGLNSLRGFNENFFFVSNYALGNLEFRVQSDAGTYFLIFYDQAVIRDKTLGQDKIDYPFGTGIGLSFATNSGIFNFAFAVGKSAEQIFSLNSAKIHFGYTGRF